MARLGDHVIVIGGSIADLYAQGMSAAALQVEALQLVLAERLARNQGLDGIAASVFPQAAETAEINTSPWSLAANFDFAYPQTRGERPPGAEARARYFAALDQLQSEDVAVQRLMTEVFLLLRPLSALQAEPLRSRVCAYRPIR